MGIFAGIAVFTLAPRTAAVSFYILPGTLIGGIVVHLIPAKVVYWVVPGGGAPAFLLLALLVSGFFWSLLLAAAYFWWTSAKKGLGSPISRQVKKHRRFL